MQVDIGGNEGRIQLAHVVGDLVKFSVAGVGKDMVGVIVRGPTSSVIAKREGWLKTNRPGRGVRVQHLKTGSVFGKRHSVVKQLTKVRHSK